MNRTPSRTLALRAFAAIAALAVAGVMGLAPVPAEATPTMRCGLNQVGVAESATWSDYGTYLTPGASVAVTGSGSIWAGYLLTGTNGPRGWNNPGGSGYPMPAAPAFSLLGSASNAWTYVGTSGTVRNTSSRTQLLGFRTNDNVPGNGSGAFTASYTTCDLSTAPVSQYSLHLLQVRHSQACLVPLGGSSASGADVVANGCYGSQNTWTPRPLSDGVNYQILNSSGNCLTVAGGATGDAGDVIQQSCSTGATNQQWSFVATSSGYYEIVARNSGKCLDVSGFGTAPNTNVFQWTCLAGTNQQWHFLSLMD